jgi:hypothetical protein
MFTKDKLNAAAVGEKWNLVKVICTQPFSKHFQVTRTSVFVHFMERFDGFFNVAKLKSFTFQMIKKFPVCFRL